MKIIEEIIRREGGYVDNPNDPGGATNMGITQNSLAEFRGRPASKEDIRNLTFKEATQIYRYNYVKKPGFDRINSSHVRSLVVDTAVLMGRGTAVRILQRSLGVKVDGLLGPKTLAAANAHTIPTLITKILKLRLRRIGTLVSDNARYRQKGQIDKDLSVFCAGWINRTLEFMK